jgi:hypothetical protein
MSVGRWVTLVLAGLALGPAPARGDDGREGFLKRMVREDRRAVEEVRRETEEFIQGMQRHDGFVIDDLKKLQEAAEAEAELWEKAAQLWEQGRDREARAARETAEGAEKDTELWRRRLSDWRRRQAEAWPDERWYRDEVRWLRPGARDAFHEVLRARRAESEAWGRLAEATVPGADRTLLFDLREAAYAAEAEQLIAEWRCNLARLREEVWQDKRVDSPELRQRFEALEKLQEERIDIKRADVQRNRRLREIEEQRRAGEQAFRRTYDTAREKEAR